MASINANKAKQALLSKGFVKDDSHHHFYLFMHNGKVVAKTKMSHNDQDLNDHLISKMWKQCRLDNKGQFLDLVNCPLNQQGYIEILTNKGDIQE